MTPLCELAVKYGCDKTPSIHHRYTPYYHELLQGRTIRAVLEIGIFKGASLRMWRDYFPEALIWGIDNDPNCLVQEERIQSLLCDQSDPVSLNEFGDKFCPYFDLIVDDGSHNEQHQKISFWMLFPLLKTGGLYVIEDVQNPTRLSEYIHADHTIKNFGPLPPDNDDCLIVIEKGNNALQR